MDGNERQRRQEEATPRPRAEQTGGDLERAQQEASRFAAAGADAIRRALSTDSKAFLASVKQTSAE